MDLQGLTLTQRTMVQLLADYKLHTSTELQTCLSDGLAPVDAIYYHVSQIRKVLRPNGADILCVRGTKTNRTSSYQLIRLTASAYDGIK